VYNLIGFFIVCLLSFLAWREKALRLSGAVCAVCIGTMILVGTGIKGFLLLSVFFVTSSFFSKWKREQKQSIDQIVAKGDARDWVQVLANGGVPALCSFIYILEEDPIWIFAFAVSLACSTADTWASEIGVLSQKDPYLLFPFKRVRKGTSGAISLRGTFASLMGAIVIGLTAQLLWFHMFSIHLMIWIIVFGFFGMVLDSIIGRSIQAKFLCTTCQLITEKNYHCDQPTVFFKGVRYVNNDIVNILSILISTALSFLLYSSL
jgi:uncharacterized protein (TIGR00297 family)